MNCSICQAESKHDEDVINLPIYSIGSEGTDACLSCRIKITQFVQALMSMRTKGFMQGYKKASK